MTDDDFVAFPDNGCFGCSPSRADGLGIRFRRRADRILAEYAIRAGFHGAPDVAHGGIVATVFDELCCAAAAWRFGSFVVTGELTVRYHRPVPVEVPMRWEAWVASADHPRYLVVASTVHHDGHELAHASAKIFRNTRLTP